MGFQKETIFNVISIQIRSQCKSIRIHCLSIPTKHTLMPLLPSTSLQAVALSLPSSVGLVGIIVDLRAIAEEVIFQPSTGGGQAFLIGSEGKILAESSPSGEEVASYEPEKLWPTLKSRSNGKKRLGRVVYTWRKVQGSPYTVVLASAFNAPNQVL